MPYKDKEKQRQAQQRHYESNKGRYKESLKSNRSKRKAWLKTIKSELSCSSCGMTDYRCLDFHHRDPASKEFGISDGVKSAFSEERIKREIEKCDVLCSNCHFRHHWSPKDEWNRPHVTENMKWLQAYKSQLCCSSCSVSDPIVLAFHHPNEEEKRYEITSAACRGVSVAKLLVEISKCDVLCFNCHRIEHDGNVWENCSLGA